MQRQNPVPPTVYLLADHLDAVLAACEDLLRLSHEQAPSLLRASLRRLELQALMHLLRAREHAKKLSRADRRISDEAALFLAATASLPTAAKELVSRSDSRANLEEFLVSHRIRIGGGVPIDTASALAATLLDALERYYILYEDAEPDSIINHAPYSPFQSDSPSASEARSNLTARRSAQ